MIHYWRSLRRHDLWIVRGRSGAGNSWRAIKAARWRARRSRHVRFHETKNIISCEGGSLLVRRSPILVPRARNHSRDVPTGGRFFRGEVDKYTWQGRRSSFLPGDSPAAIPRAQLQHSKRSPTRGLRTGSLPRIASRRWESPGLLRPSDHNPPIASTMDILLRRARAEDRSQDVFSIPSSEYVCGGVSLCARASSTAGQRASDARTALFR